MTTPLPPVPGPQSTNDKGMLTPPWQAWFYQLYNYLVASQAKGGAGFLTPNSSLLNTVQASGGASSDGEDGERGPPGPAGPPGTSVTGAQGPIGPAVFLEAPDGEPGDPGTPGPPGPQGNPGAQGLPGVQGSPGVAVYLEAQEGEPGQDGIPGPVGPIGPAGSAGSQGVAGPAGPAIFLEGEMIEGDIGPPGVAGIAGAAGAQGIAGPAGPAVFLEAEMIEGDLGPPGVQGIQGLQGVQGNVGSQGPVGPAVFLLGDPGDDGRDGDAIRINVASNPQIAPFWTANAIITGSLNAGAFNYGTLGYTDTNIFCSFTSSVNSYNQIILQNTNAGAAASTDFIVSNNSGTSSNFYGDFGINSSAFSGTGALGAANNVYLYSQGVDLAIGTGSANSIHFVINGSATDAATCNSSGNWTFAAASSGNTVTVTGNTVSTNFQTSGTNSSATSVQDVYILRSSSANTIQNGPNITFSDGTATNTVALQMGAGTFGIWNYGSGAWVQRVSLNSTGNFSIAAPSSGAALTLPAGTTTVEPLLLTSGTNLTTATAGVVEYDGTVAYFTPTASCRGVLASEQIQILNATYTLTSQTAAQKLFNATTNGTLTLPLGTFEFECAFALSSLNTGTSSVFGFAIGGTAVITQSWDSEAKSGTLATAATPSQTFNTAANTALVAANTTGLGYAKITGIIRVTTAGTIIPQVSLNTSAAAVVAVGSYFKIRPIGSSTVTNVGNWS